MIKDVTDLDVYNQSLELLKEIYSLCSKLPSSEKDVENQIKRSAKSISANIAEGYAKRSSVKEFKRFLKISIGSSDEVQSHLRTIIITIPFLIKSTQQLLEKYKILSKRINALHNAWQSV